MKHKAPIILMLTLIWTLVACTGKPTAVPTSPPTPKSLPTPTQDPHVVRVGISTDSPPFVDVGPKGFDIDLIQAIAEGAGFQIAYVETNDWAHVFEDLADGRFDVVISMASITEERQAIVDFSAPYFEAGQAIAVRQGSTIQSPANLDGRRVSAQEGSTGAQWVEEQTSAILVSFTDARQAFEALTQGDVEACVYDRLSLATLINQHPEANVTLLDETVTNEPYGIAVRKERADLLQQINTQLEALEASGVYLEICEKWLPRTACQGPTPPSITSTPDTPETKTPPPTDKTPTMSVRILYGSEKEDWLAPLVEAYNAAGRQTPQGSTIVIEATAIGSIEAATAILSGTIEATVWSPASSLYLPVARSAWRERYGSELVFGEPQSLVRSPVIIAMWEPMARALGWPDQPLGWHTIAGLSGHDWSEWDHPEWGSFKFGHTHPDYSNSGLAAILSEAYAGVDKQSDLTLEDLQTSALRTFMAQIEGSIIDYGSSTGFFAQRMYDCEIGGPAYLSASVLYENLVAVRSQTCPNHPAIVALYPSEGTFWTDHPYVILNAPWVSDEQKAAAQDFQAFLLDATQQQRAMALGFRPADPTLPLRTPLDAAHGVDPDQPQTVLAPPSPAVIEGTQQTWRQVKKAADVVVVLDISGSMWAEEAPGQGTKIEKARVALGNFVDMLSDVDRLQVIVFNNELTTLTPLSPLGEKRTAIKDAIMGIQPDGPTRLNDVTLQAYEDLKAEGDPNRIRAVVILSDGRDERLLADGSVEQASTNDLPDVLEAIQVGQEGGRAIKFFTIAYGADADAGTLEQIAQTTGGKRFDASTETIRQVYELIALFF